MYTWREKGGGRVFGKWFRHLDVTFGGILSIKEGEGGKRRGKGGGFDLLDAVMAINFMGK
jgi:hypothetical protein